MVALALLKAYWKQIALLVLVGLLVWRVWSAITSYGQEQYTAGYDRRESEYAAAKEKQRVDHIAEMKRQEKVSNEIVTDLQSKLDAINDRPPGKPVWMCKQPASVPGTTGPAPHVNSPGADEETQSGSSQQVRDIGPGTRAILDDGDAAIEELNALQDWTVSNCLAPASRSN